MEFIWVTNPFPLQVLAASAELGRVCSPLAVSFGGAPALCPPQSPPHLSQGRDPGGETVGTCGLGAGRGHAGALAAGEGVQGPRLPGQGAAAEPMGAARSSHAACGVQRQGARGATAAAGGPGELRARGGHGRAERQPLGGAGRAAPGLGSVSG